MITGGLHKRGKIWYAVWHENGRQRWKSTGKTSKAEAAVILADMVTPLNAGDRARALREASDKEYARRGEQIGRQILIKNMFQIYEASPERPDAAAITLKGYRAQFRRFENWLAEHHPKATAAADVMPGIASEFAAWLSHETGSGTYNKYIACLRMVWKTISKRGGLTENPWNMIAMKRHRVISKRELTIEEIRRLIDSQTGEWRLLFIVGTFSALRLGDCATLRWDEVDIDAGHIIRVPRKTASRTGKAVIIPIFSDLQRELQLIKADARSPYVMPTLAKKYFHAPTTFNYHVGQIFKRAGIKCSADEVPANRIKHPTLAGFHSLRHSFVSLMRRANAPEAVVMSLVGHGSPAMTRHYTHIGEAAARQAIAAMPSLGADVFQEERAALPQWAADLVQDMTSDNWSDVRSALLSGHRAPTAPLGSGDEPGHASPPRDGGDVSHDVSRRGDGDEHQPSQPSGVHLAMTHHNDLPLLGPPSEDIPSSQSADTPSAPQMSTSI